MSTPNEQDKARALEILRDLMVPATHERVLILASALSEQRAALEAMTRERDEVRAIVADRVERAEKAEGELRRVLDFLVRAAYQDKEIVSTCRLSVLSIENYRRAGLMYVEPGGGLGWVVRTFTPWMREAPSQDGRGGSYPAEVLGQPPVLQPSEAEAALQKARADQQAAFEEAIAFREALHRISTTPCGVPGHSVAVGCGAAAVAYAALRARSSESQPGDKA